ncbi:hypothetical protein J4573_47485 [Actinomadura barringtoniae]|uniref:Uncharacterized protein n=1 Tax=Actinomadura barringtoniae TaxID=1427535 RepID=A0A939PRA3_9ACTN|nr:hypothetical protein [Actinomadura barringtoniae]MBO2454803.1 hypothetical protein [Actinomadura barringtoniae]
MTRWVSAAKSRHSCGRYQLRIFVSETKLNHSGVYLDYPHGARGAWKKICRH